MPNKKNYTLKFSAIYCNMVVLSDISEVGKAMYLKIREPNNKILIFNGFCYLFSCFQFSVFYPVSLFTTCYCS